MEFHFNFLGGIYLDGKMILPPAGHAPITIDPRAPELFGLTFLQRKLAALGRCPFCKARALTEALDLMPISVMQCGACTKLLILPNGITEPFVMPPHVEESGT